MTIRDPHSFPSDILTTTITPPSSAIALGIGLQLTNILRDVGEDLERGRIYLPLDELAMFGLTGITPFLCCLLPYHSTSSTIITLLYYQPYLSPLAKAYSRNLKQTLIKSLTKPYHSLTYIYLLRIYLTLHHHHPIHDSRQRTTCFVVKSHRNTRN